MKNVWPASKHVACTLLALALPSVALALVKVRNVNDLLQEETVQYAMHDVVQVSQSNVVYKFCKDEYVLTPEQITYQQQAFEDIIKQAQHVMYEAYVKKAGIPPSPHIVSDYTQYIYKQEAAVMKATAIDLQTNHCGAEVAPKSIRFIEKRRYTELARKKQEQEQVKTKQAPTDYTNSTATP